MAIVNWKRRARGVTPSPAARTEAALLAAVASALPWLPPLNAWLDSAPPALAIEAVVMRVTAASLIASIVLATFAEWRRPAIVAAGCAGGLLWFEILFGLRIVEPRQLAWLMHGNDSRWHQIAWEFFRNEPWTVPPGRITRMLSPVGSSIANTDSLPVAAFACKICRGFLPDDFQYFGVSQLFAFALHGLFAALLTLEIGGTLLFQLGALALLICNTIALSSREHAALESKCWLILASLYLYVRPPGAASRRAEAFAWLALAGLSAWIHPYVCVMVLAIGTAAWAHRWWPDHLISGLQAMLGVAASLAVVVVLWWIAGYFAVGSYHWLLGGDLGRWSMNLVAPINPMGWSRFLPAWTIGEGQYEGACYFGAGILALMVCGALVALWRPPGRTAVAQYAPLLLVCAALTLVALSPTIMFGSAVVVQLPAVLYAPFAPFRASGRFFAVVFFVLLILSLRLLRARLPARLAATLVIGALTLQIMDLHDGLAGMRADRFREEQFSWNQPLDWGGWTAAVRPYRTLILLGPWDEVTQVAFAYFAARTGLATNLGEAARTDFTAVYHFRHQQEEEIARGIVDPTALYVVHPDQLTALLATGGVACSTLDGFHTCTAR
jgi:hypothetical protein